MALIPNLSEIPDVLPITTENLNAEYDFTITKVKEVKSKRTGRYGCQLSIKFDGMDNVSDIFHTLWYGNFKDYTADDEDKSNMMWRMVKEFLTSLGIDPNEETDESDIVGLTFTAEVNYNDGFSTDDSGSPVKVGQPRNEIVRIL